MANKPLPEISNQELLDLFEETVQWWHYNPADDWEMPTSFRPSQLKEEILRRMSESVNLNKQ